ncbi:cation:proton antiporter [Jonesia denitrificans]|uniref:Na+/H+ antiporter subunit n=1 Tax=Jonesia denitrificans (strain ATCC 14870 / DSM 20603 / BCRC 15368 / CIP 55.134 / JCM 11481 / NBRC 15587 / NCTC 10816 / Prevot 55134) TaxID=471856 RepID=C7R003_JONDD|nr:monovalent cation/H(+) antiporter subunit G [Jonesia denitrificans]ACV09561.1 Na+/H+ antiporter subunit [Jonesia denitrificans DSM 20603]ASE09211.1 cation:proton antiporter [Jonesia denitrificans]QXB43753.1 monovalent cation/H(+) antiporter subunit G [Jonesia denitrificans]SQH21980.1 Multiple resistance and pH homeostasis protein G [Jonesia denitrificans]
MTIADIIGNVLLILGALLFASGALGIIKFPDPYTRISAVGTAGGIGIILVIAGTVFLAPGLSNAVKAIIIVALQLGTSAIGSIAIARSAYLTGVPLYEQHFNDLDERE